jgi:hypothetical protein
VGRTAYDVLEQARAAFGRRSWADAYEGFVAADDVTPLELNDLESLALSAYLSGRDEEATRAWTRAHHEAVRHNDAPRATRYAVAIGAALVKGAHEPLTAAAHGLCLTLTRRRRSVGCQRRVPLRAAATARAHDMSTTSIESQRRVSLGGRGRPGEIPVPA